MMSKLLKTDSWLKHSEQVWKNSWSITWSMPLSFLEIQPKLTYRNTPPLRWGTWPATAYLSRNLTHLCHLEQAPGLTPWKHLKCQSSPPRLALRAHPRGGDSWHECIGKMIYPYCNWRFFLCGGEVSLPKQRPDWPTPRCIHLRLKAESW